MNDQDMTQNASQTMTQDMTIDNAPAQPVCRGEPIPKVPIYLAMGLVFLSLIFVIGARYVGVETYKLPNDNVVQTRQVIWQLNQDQSITVKDANSGVVLETVAVADRGFIHSAYRGLAHERKVKRVPMETPLTITLNAKGRYMLIDEATDEQIYLRAFGRDNEASIGRYLTLQAGDAS